jgi:hypothetical protein
VAAYGVSEAAPAAEAAPELPLLQERFNMRPSLTKGILAQRAGPIELVIGRDYMQYWQGRLTPAEPPATICISWRQHFIQGSCSSAKQIKRQLRPWRRRSRGGSPEGRGSQQDLRPHRPGGRLAGYTIPRVVSPIPKSFFESFESLPPTLENCVIRIPETMQERLLFGIMVDAGMVLSKPHFRIQKERTHRREVYRKFNSD